MVREDGTTKYFVVKIPELKIENIKNYNNQPDYKSDIELFNLANKTLKDENNTLNKGIDELIEKYEEMVKLFDGDSYVQTMPIEMLEDLKKLKGE